MADSAVDTGAPVRRAARRAGGGRPLWAYVALVLGFGCFFVVCPFSELAVAGMLQCGLGWRGILFTHATCMLAAAACLAMRQARMRYRHAHRGSMTTMRPGARKECRRPCRGILVGGCVTTASVLLLLPADGVMSGWLRVTAYGCLAGVSMVLMCGEWLWAFFSVRRARGRMSCLMAMTTSFLVTVILTWIIESCTPPGVGVGMIVIMVVLVALSCALFMLALRGLKTSPTDPGEDVTGHAGEEGPFLTPVVFGLTRYSRVALLSLGILWGMGYSVPIEVGYGTGFDQLFRWITTLVSCGVLLVALVALMHVLDIDDVRFGLLLRWVIVLAGILWAFTPLLAAELPIALDVTFIMMFWIELMMLFLFVMEVCLETGVLLSVVLARYFGLFAFGSVAGATVFLAVKAAVGVGGLMYTLLSAIGATVALVVMPFMPSRGENAQVFTFEQLPEDEGVRERNDRMRRAFERDCGFTPREAEVFELLVLGQSRDDIASALDISPYTVKNHIHAVFVKTGSQSAKELMGMVYGSREW